MSAQMIYNTAPIGALIAWSDGTPRPPLRHRKKLAAWQTRNSKGCLIQKQGERGVGNVTLPATFTLHEADFGAGGVVAIRVHRTFSLASTLRFTVVELRIPTEAGGVIRHEAGQRSDLMSATIPN